MRSTKSRIVVAFATAILLFSAFIVTPVTNKAHAQVKPKAFILVPGILTSSSSTDPKSIPGNGFWGNVYTTLKGAYPDAIFYEYSYIF